MLVPFRPAHGDLTHPRPPRPADNGPIPILVVYTSLNDRSVSDRPLEIYD